MTVLTLAARKSLDTGDALSVLDTLRGDIESGRIVAFTAAGVAVDDVVMAYASSTDSVSRLRMLGSISNLLHCYQCGDL